MKTIALAAASVLAGCSQILGLEGTTFEQRDATVDAPSTCDGAPRCTSGSGRSVCGQLYGTGETAGQLLRAASPTGETCAALNSTTGPCAYGVYAQSVASYHAGDSASRIVGEIDDCGRYFVTDIETTIDDIAVVFTGNEIVESVSLKLDRELEPGVDTGVDAHLVVMNVPMTWAMQVDATNPPTIDAGYLVTYVDAAGQRIPMQELRVGGGPVGDPPTVPWGAYFSGDGAYGTIDGTATKTGPSGSALVVPGGAPFSLGGFRTGGTCDQINLQPHANAFIHLTVSC